MDKKSNHIFSETDLIEGSLNGDRTIQKELYDRFASKMYGVCLRYASSAEEAQDILQDGFIKVFRKLGSFRREGSLEGWIRRIFVNTAIEQYRKKVYLQPVTESQQETLDAHDVSALDRLSEKDIIAMVQRLSPGYRTVFNLYAVEGYTHKQIAEELGISEGTSKSQLSRARLILQEMVRSAMEMKDKATN